MTQWTGEENKMTEQVRGYQQGIGIPPEDVKRVFDKYYRTRRSKAEEFCGHDLGLYITRLLVEAHGGQIWVESDGERGSCFFFTLPIYPV